MFITYLGVYCNMFNENQTTVKTEKVTITKKEYRALLATVYASEDYLTFAHEEHWKTRLEQKVKEYWTIRKREDKIMIKGALKSLEL